MMAGSHGRCAHSLSSGREPVDSADPPLRMSEETRQHGTTPPRRPPAPVRWIGKAEMRLVARAPQAWRIIRRPTRLFFDSLAAGWDKRVQPDSPEHLAALFAGIENIQTAPQRILDLGTGTGAAALALARRFPEARVEGVDISERMISAAREKAGDDLADRVRFSIADAAALPFEPESFDLVTQVSVPVFFDRIARLLRPEGHIIVVSSLGKATPYYLPNELLRRHFERRGLRAIAAGKAGTGTFFVAQRS
jgi:SAM-dependent methyltransferase